MENFTSNTQVLRRSIIRAAFIFIFLLFNGFSWSQTLTSKNKKAVKLYDDAKTLMGSRDFDKAFDKLQQAIERDPNFAEAYLKLASIYRINFNDSMQRWCYHQVIDRYPDAARFASSWYALGESEFKMGQYEEALNYLTKYKELTSEKGRFSSKAKLMIDNSNFAIEYKVNDFQFNPRPLPAIINQFKQQYFPVLTADQNTILFIKREGDEEILQTDKDESGAWQEPHSISNNINSEYNEGTCSISADGRMLVFTSCMGRRGYGSCDLYTSRKVGKEWSVPENLGEKVNSSAWDSQPSLSADGRTLYFVSNRRGGFGKRDIYVTHKDENGTWETPKNIGSDINTSFDDISPFIHPNGQRLYFATNGRLGFGGFDIYFSNKDTQNGWKTPTNFGYPINTHNDEVSMFISADGSKGYYSHEERGDKNIRSTLYEIDIPPQLQIEHKTTYVYGKVTDSESGMPLKASISLVDLNTETIIEMVSSDLLTGDYLIVLTEGADYGLFAESEGYLYKSVNFNLREEILNPVKVNLYLDPIKAGRKVVLENIFFDFDSYTLSPQSQTELNKVLKFLKSNETLRVEISGYTDNVGNEKYNLELSDKRAKSVYDYLVNSGINKSKLGFKGYGASNFLKSNDSKEGRAVNRRIEFKILK